MCPLCQIEKAIHDLKCLSYKSFSISLATMPIANPTSLVEEFKKSGEFDRLRRELLTQFQHDDSYADFKSGIEEIARQRLQSDQMLAYLPQDLVHKELMQEVERYPIVERAVADVRIFSDQTFVSGIQNSVKRILQESKGGKPSATEDLEGSSSANARISLKEAIANQDAKAEATTVGVDQSTSSKPPHTEILDLPQPLSELEVSPGPLNSTQSEDNPTKSSSSSDMQVDVQDVEMQDIP